MRSPQFTRRRSTKRKKQTKFDESTIGWNEMNSNHFSLGTCWTSVEVGDRMERVLVQLSPTTEPNAAIFSKWRTSLRDSSYSTHLQFVRNQWNNGQINAGFAWVCEVLLFIGMINCGITGWILSPPELSRSRTPWRAYVLYGCFVSDSPSKNRGKYSE